MAVKPDAEGGPIPLNAAQQQAVKEWAADDRLWTTQETVEMNLRTFARVVLRAYRLEPMGSMPANRPQPVLPPSAGIDREGLAVLAERVERIADQLDGQAADVLNQAAAALRASAPRSEGEWRPIETAAEDGQWVWMLNEKTGRVSAFRWDDSHDGWFAVLRLIPAATATVVSSVSRRGNRLVATGEPNVHALGTAARSPTKGR